MEPTVAFLSQGRLFLKQPGQAVREIESPFALEALERQARSRANDGWKSRSGIWGEMGMAPPSMAQWDQAGEEAARRVAIRSVCRGPQPTDLMYILDLETVSGVFRYDLTANQERRLMHRNDFVARDLACHRPSGTLVVSLASGDGGTTLAFSHDEGRHWTRVSGGDGLDQAPSWAPGDGKRVVFQSAAIGRNQQGVPFGVGPYAIETIDLDGDSKVQTLVAEDGRDYLLPRRTADGGLLFIRRPYRPAGHAGVGLGQLLWDLLLLPFRLVMTILHLFNFLSVMLSGQPLATALGQARRGQRDQQFMMLWGQMIDARSMLAKGAKDQPAALVPKEWQLIRRAASGAEQVAAEAVLAFDVSSSGDLVYTNGSAIYVQRTGGRAEKLCDGGMIESVLWVE